MGGASPRRVSKGRTVVDIGPSHWHDSQAFTRLGRPTERHVIVRLPNEPGLLSEKIVSTLPEAHARRLVFVDAGAGRLSVKPASADEVYFSDPSIHNAGASVFNLAAGLLKPGGHLFVAEQSNPFAFPASRARALALAAGLEPVEVRFGRRSAAGYRTFASSFKPLPSRFADQRFVLAARRPSLLRSPRKR